MPFYFICVSTHVFCGGGDHSSGSFTCLGACSVTTDSRLVRLRVRGDIETADIVDAPKEFRSFLPTAAVDENKC